jgi:glycosyltransferase involved in cell wall biosynthesis
MFFSPQSNKIHVWIPNMFDFKGGVQVYSSWFLQALQNNQPQSKYDIFLKHDTRLPREHPFQVNTRFHFSGKFPSSIRTFAYAGQLFKEGLLQKPDLIISTHLNFTPVAAWLKRIAGIPYWTVAHGVDAWNIENPTLKKGLQQADKILAVSYYTRDRLLREQNLSSNQVVLLPNTFDANRFEIKTKPTHLIEKYNLQPHQPIILTVNRLCATEIYKGYDKVLEALPKIQAKMPNTHYIIVGKGDDRARLENYIQELGLEDSVTLAGFVPDEELCDYYNLCDVFAMPSKLEGFGIVYLEALACGKPCLGGNQDGAIDALCNGEFGALVDPDNVEEIAQTLIKILEGNYSKPLLYQPQALREKVIETYGFDRFQERLAKLLNDSPIGLKQ